jgi:hypothetical protein
MYTRESMVLLVLFKGDTKIVITGVRIMVMNPLDISEIILAILLLSIVYCNQKLWGLKGGCDMY